MAEMNTQKAGTQESRLAIVTGGGGGIGLGIGERLLAAGYKVALWDFNADAAEKAARKLDPAGNRCIATQCDVSDERAVEHATQKAESAFGVPYLLVNGAAIRHRVPLRDLPRASWDREIATNLTGVFQCTQTVGRRMLDAGRGVILNLSSIAGLFGQPVRGAYSPSKAGIVGLTNVTAVEWGPLGIRCNAISPGMIVTPIHEKAYADAAVKKSREDMVPMGRLGTPDDIADVVVFLASDGARYINGANIRVDGGFGQNLIGLIPVPGESSPQ